MGITSIQRDWGVSPSIVRITSTDNLATVAGSAYLTAQDANIQSINNGAFAWVVGDLVAVAASDGSEFFRFSGNDFTTLIQLPGGNGAVTLPVVDQDFCNFDGTLGAIEDLGFSASDATKTKVVMAAATVIANHIACFSDTAGTIDDDAATAINAGNIQAGLSGTAGALSSFPATGSKGHLAVVGVANTGDTVTTISNAAMGQASVISIPDPAGATADFVLAPAALVSGNLIKASGTAGLVADQGFAMKSVAKAATNGGSVTVTFTDAFCTTGSVVVGNWVVQTTPAEVIVIVPGNGSFAVTSTADVGTTSSFSYIITK